MIVWIGVGMGLIELGIGLIELGIGLIEFGKGLIELRIGRMELGIGLRINNARRTVLARVSGLVPGYTFIRIQIWTHTYRHSLLSFCTERTGEPANQRTSEPVNQPCNPLIHQQWNKPDCATMRPGCVSACIEFGAKHVIFIER